MTDRITDILNFFREETNTTAVLTPDTDLVMMTCNHEDDFTDTMTAFSDHFEVDVRAMNIWFHIYPEVRSGPRVRPYIPLTARLLAKAVAAGEWRMTYPQPPDGGWSNGDRGWGMGRVFGIVALITCIAWALW